MLSSGLSGLNAREGGSIALSDAKAFTAYLKPLHEAEGVVYAKPPFGGPRQVLAYLGRSTHCFRSTGWSLLRKRRVAISNQRLLAMQGGRVTFQWKDYKHKNKHNSKHMQVDAHEFIRRFLPHTLPPGFQRIRHFGFLANCHRKAKLALCRQILLPPIVELLPQPSQTRPLLDFLTKNKPVTCPHLRRRHPGPRPCFTRLPLACCAAAKLLLMRPLLGRRFAYGQPSPPDVCLLPATLLIRRYFQQPFSLCQPPPPTPPLHRCSASSSVLAFSHQNPLSLGIRTP
jgi:hypothetical protein